MKKIFFASLCVAVIFVFVSCDGADLYKINIPFHITDTEEYINELIENAPGEGTMNEPKALKPISEFSLDDPNSDTGMLGENSGWVKLLTAIADQGVYVDLDLSNCTMPVNEAGEAVFDLAATGTSGKQYITSLILPDTATRVQVKDQNPSFPAQSSFLNLTSITLPASITSIGPAAFLNYNSLTTVICLAETPPRLEGDGLYYTFPNNISIYVPAISLQLYKNTNPWSVYANNIKPIPD